MGLYWIFRGIIVVLYVSLVIVFECIIYPLEGISIILVFLILGSSHVKRCLLWINKSINLPFEKRTEDILCKLSKGIRGNLI